MSKRCSYCETSIYNCECPRCAECDRRIPEDAEPSECNPGTHDNYGFGKDPLICAQCCTPDDHCSDCDQHFDMCECDDRQECPNCHESYDTDDFCTHDHCTKTGYCTYCLDCCNNICADCGYWQQGTVCECEGENEDDEDFECDWCGEYASICDCEPSPEYLAAAEMTRSPSTLKRCQHQSNNGWICTRRSGHPGRHVGHGYKTVVAVWTDSGEEVYEFDNSLTWKRSKTFIAQLKGEK